MRLAVLGIYSESLLCFWNGACTQRQGGKILPALWAAERQGATRDGWGLTQLTDSCPFAEAT